MHHCVGVPRGYEHKTDVVNAKSLNYYKKISEVQPKF